MTHSGETSGKKQVRSVGRPRTMQNVQPRRQAEAQKSTSFLDLIRWLIRRRQMRRRYGAATIANERQNHMRASLLYILLLTMLCSVIMAEAQLHRADTLTDAGRYPARAESVSNPALRKSDITCSVTLKVGTDDVTAWNTPVMTVADMIEDAGCVLSGDAYVVPSPDTVVTDGMEISVIRVTYEDSREEVVLPYGTDYIDIQTIPMDSTERISDGMDGSANQLLRRRYENGELCGVEVLESETLIEPVNEQLYRGVGGTVSCISGTFHYSYYIDVTATAYGPPEFTGLTYSGTQVRRGVVAVDPKVIPLGTKMIVKGDYRDFGYCSAEDIGGGIKNNHIDIWMDATIEEMLEFGIRKMRVYILD